MNNRKSKAGRNVIITLAVIAVCIGLIFLLFRPHNNTEIGRSGESSQEEETRAPLKGLDLDQVREDYKFSLGANYYVAVTDDRSAYAVRFDKDGNTEVVGKDDFPRKELGKWTDIVGVSAGYKHYVGLRSDGTVVAIGSNDDGQCNVGKWSDIVAISAGANHTVGLKSDGTVVATGDNKKKACDIGDWKNIISVSAGEDITVGLKKDGTVIAVGSNDCGQTKVDGWKNIKAISAGGRHVVGLKDDGTVVAVGDNSDGQCDVKDWQGIKAVSAGGLHTVGLKSDGTMTAVGNNDYSQCVVNVDDFEKTTSQSLDTGEDLDEDGGKRHHEIVAISAGWHSTIGLEPKSDGEHFTIWSIGAGGYLSGKE